MDAANSLRRFCGGEAGGPATSCARKGQARLPQAPAPIPRRLLSRRTNKQSRLLWPDGEVGHCGHHHLEFTSNLPEECDVRCVCSGIRALEVHRKAQPVSRLSDRDDGVGGAPAAAKEMSPRIAAVATTLFWAFHKCLADDRLMG